MAALHLLLIAVCAGAQNPSLLLQKPTISATTIVFSFAGDLWKVDRHGGDAVRLTSGVGIETDPHFSPDGTLVAFTGEYDGNTDVYVVPVAGGVPKRLTWHPAADTAVGWRGDGERVLFASTRDNPHGLPRLYTVPVDGGMPEIVPLPIASEGSYSPDGKQLAYIPGVQQVAWKRYRGGETTGVLVADLATSRIVDHAPRNNTNDFDPMWVRRTIYFLSDRNGPVTLFSYSLDTHRVRQVLPNSGLDLKSASAGPGAIVFEQFGRIGVLDTATDRATMLDIRIAADLPQVRPRYMKVSDRIRSAGISPSGARAVFGARGEIYTVPAEKGDARNITRSPAADDRDPAWSPDGKWIAYISDESGEDALFMRSPDGSGAARKIDLGDPPSHFYGPVWSPDSRCIAYGDARLNLWYVEVVSGKRTKVDTNPKPLFSFHPVWSPDSRWIGYARQLTNYMGAAFAYSLDTGKALQLTDGLSDVQRVAFDRGGKYLYLDASTNVGTALWFADMSSMERPVSRSVYVMVLRKGDPSPLAPESDEEKAGASDPKPTPNPVQVRIDADRITQRTLALPLAARNYTDLQAGKDGVLFLSEAPLVGAGSQPLHRFDLKARKDEVVLPNVSQFVVSANGEKLLYSQGARWAIAATSGPVNAATGTLQLDGMEAYVDPPAEWRSMYYAAWRGLRDYFYAPNLHGVDVAAMERKYEPYLAGIASRNDLNYLFREMLGEVTISHMFPGGGDEPTAPAVRGGLLGTDYAVENGRYRFARVYDGESWNPQLRAPLTQPGVDVVAGEYLLAVNGKPVLPPDEVHRYLEHTAGTQVVLRVGPNADGTGARDVTVLPLASDTQLRYLAWIEDNRRKVDALSGGRLAYVHMPDTSNGGYASFNRYFFAQVGKQGAIIDERFNGGGLLADYVIDYLRRPLAAFFTQRNGDDFAMPTAAIFGPKAMLINEFAGSGGDYMPWAFRDARIGPLIGRRTWGGLVGASGVELMDGGNAGAPRSGIWNPNGTWDVENWGVAPDIEVDLDPAAWRAGRDPQLEEAVDVLLADLDRHPQPQYRRPPYPNYHRGRPVVPVHAGDAASRP